MTKGNKEMNAEKKRSPRNKSNNNNKRNFNRKNHRRHRPRKNHSGGGEQSLEKLQKRYLQLIEQHRINRKKYYDEFHHHDPNRVRKLRNAFERSGNELFQFAEKLSEDNRKIILREQPTIDEYADNRSISPIGEILVAKENIEDPHFLQTQQDASFSQDKEESIGTMDEYRAYKEGLKN